MRTMQRASQTRWSHCVSSHPGGMKAECIRPLAVSPFCSLSPTIGAAFGEDSTVGERVGVRGRERVMWPPHPSPLPRNTPSRASTPIAGERGQAADRRWANAPVPARVIPLASLRDAEQCGNRSSGGVAALNHRRIAVTPPGSDAWRQCLVASRSVAFRSAKGRSFAERRTTYLGCSP